MQTEKWSLFHSVNKSLITDQLHRSNWGILPVKLTLQKLDNGKHKKDESCMSAGKCDDESKHYTLIFLSIRKKNTIQHMINGITNLLT